LNANQQNGAKDMLTLTIKDGESVYIGDDIQITVSEAGGRGKHKVHIAAPADQKILRESLLERLTEHDKK